MLPNKSVHPGMHGKYDWRTLYTASRIMPSLYCLGVTVDDKDFVRLFEGNLPSPEDRAAILNQPHSDRVREYVDQSQPQRREEHLGILDKGRYKISFDRQKRAAIIGVHTRSVGLEDAPVADFAGA